MPLLPPSCSRLTNPRKSCDNFPALIMSTRSKVLLKGIVTLGLLAFLVSRINLREFWRVLGSAHLGILMVGVAMQFASILLSVNRWGTILANFDIRTPFLPLAKISLIGSFFNLFLPSAIGGDFFRAYYLSKREHRGMSTTLTTTILERNAGLCALLMIGACALGFWHVRVQRFSLAHLFLGLILAFILANVALFHPWMHGRLTRLLKWLKLKDVEAKLELIYSGLNALRKNRSSVLWAILLSLGIQFVSVANVWIASRAIDLDVPFHIFLAFVPLINLSIMVPLTINGIGLRESLYYLLFTQVGLSPERSVSLSLLQFSIMIMASLPGGIVYSLYKKKEHFGDLLACEDRVV